MKRALVFDTETTDLFANPLVNDAQQAHVVEFCGMMVEDDGTVSETLDFLCRPPVPMSKEAAQITGLRDPELGGHPPFAAFADRVQAMIFRADAVVAHNLFFDMRILDMEFSRIGKTVYWPNRKIDTVKETEWVIGRRMKMGELHEFLFGEKIKEAHRARNDVAALVRIYNEMKVREWL